MITLSKDNKVTLAYAGVCFFWGSTFLGIKVGLNYWPPLLMAGMRFILASILLFIFLKIRRIEWRIPFGNLKSIVLSGILMLTISNGLLCISEKSISSSLSAIMLSLIPIYIACVEFQQKKIKEFSKTMILGMVISVLGVYLLTKHEMDIKLEGVFLLIISGLFWSIGTLKAKEVPKKINPLVTSMIQMFLSGVLLIILSNITERWVDISISFNSIMPIVYLGSFGSVVAFSCYNYVLGHWSAVAAGTYTYINPIVAIILGNFLLGESITSFTMLSVSLILFGTYLVKNNSV